jgi:hypothetical protein
MPQEPTTGSSAAAPEIAPTGNQPAPQIGTEGQQQSPPVQSTPAAPSLESVQAELASERQKAAEYEKRFKDTQGAYTRSQQALAALNGTDPNNRPAPVDPLAKYVQQLQAKGYNAKEARDVAEVQYQMAQDLIAPVQQQYQQGFAALQGQTLVGDAMQQAASADQSLFQSPQVVDAVQQQLRQYAQQGGQITPQIARDIAILASYNLRASQPQNTVQFPQPVVTQGQPTPQPFRNGMFNINPSFQPSAQPGPQPLSPEAAQVDAEIKQRYNLNK